jgi:hypothetical protein
LILAVALFLGGVLIMLTTQGDDEPDDPGTEIDGGDDVGNVDGAPDALPSESASPSPSASASPTPSPTIPLSTETLPPELAGGRGPELEPQGSGGPNFATARSGAVEGSPDAEKSGVTPDYPEANSIQLLGSKRNLSVTFGFEDKLPKSMPDENTFMIVGFALSGEHEGDDGYAFGAQASNGGWQPYAGGRKEASGFPGSFSIDGHEIHMTIPWDSIGGPRPFEWYANSSWFSHVANVTSYMFDVIPNDGGRYPGK